MFYSENEKHPLTKKKINMCDCDETNEHCVRTGEHTDKAMKLYQGFYYIQRRF